MATAINSARPHDRGRAELLCRSGSAPEGSAQRSGWSHPSGPQRRAWGRVALGGLYTAIGAVSGAWCV